MNYLKDMIIKIDKDWITDFTFDFSNEIPVVDSFTTTPATGLTVVNSNIVMSNKVVVRLSTNGTANARYSLVVSALSQNGERRDMNVTFLAL